MISVLYKLVDWLLCHFRSWRGGGNAALLRCWIAIDVDIAIDIDIAIGIAINIAIAIDIAIDIDIRFRN